MEWLQLALMIGVFLLMALLMFFRKIPALIALPLMAFGIPLVVVAFQSMIPFSMSSAAAQPDLRTPTLLPCSARCSVFCCKKLALRNSLSKKAPSYPAIIRGLSQYYAIVNHDVIYHAWRIGRNYHDRATVVLPIMSSVGIGSMTVVGIFLFGLSMGGILNAGNWALYIDVMKLSLDQIRPFALTMFGITFVASLVYVTAQLYRDGHDLKLKKIIGLSASIIAVVLGGSVIYLLLPAETQSAVQSAFQMMLSGLKHLAAAGMIMLLLITVFQRFIRNNRSETVGWTAYFTPIIPLFLILIFNVNFIAAFICGLVYGFIATFRKGSLNIFVQSVLEGGAVVMPAIVLMLGIGMLLERDYRPRRRVERSQSDGWR
ncbi:MAG: citrate transporter [Calditrichia bacterium]